MIAEAIDLEQERFRYYHNASLYELADEDFRGAFRTEEVWSPDVLPPYTELIRFDAGPAIRDPELHEVARGLLRGHLDRVPPGNPFDRFAARLTADLPSLLEGDEARYHAFTFATFRMAGAGFELLALARRVAARRRQRPGDGRRWVASSKAARSSASSSPAGGRSIRPTR